jgi:hypothetical protein
MAFLLRRPFIYLVVVVVTAVALLAYTGTMNQPSASTLFTSTLLTPGTISLGTNANLTATIQNRAPATKTVELRVLCGTQKLVFYDQVNGTILASNYNGTYNIIRYPKTTKMLYNEQWTIGITVKGLDSQSLSNTYSIILELYADSQPAQTKTLLITVNRT